MKWTKWHWRTQTSSHYSYAGPSSSFHAGTVPASPSRSGTHRSGSQAAWSCDPSSSSVGLVASRWEDPVQDVLAGSQVTSGTHAGIYLRPSDIGCQYSRSIYTARFILWQPRRAADMSTSRRQSLLCCCTASMEQAADGAETAAIHGLVLSWSENISVSFCLRTPGYGLTLWCTLGLRGGVQYKCLSYSYSNSYSTCMKRNEVHEASYFSEDFFCVKPVY